MQAETCCPQNPRVKLPIRDGTHLQRRDVHPLEEARSFKGLLDLEEPKYSLEQIAAKIGKPPAYVATRLKLTELAEVVVSQHRPWR